MQKINGYCFFLTKYHRFVEILSSDDYSKIWVSQNSKHTLHTSDSILMFQNSIHLFFESKNQTYFCVALYGDFMTNLFHIET